jgi:hypothetical protein
MLSYEELQEENKKKEELLSNLEKLAVAAFRSHGEAIKKNQVHGRTAWGVQEGRRRPKAACPASRPPCLQGVKGLGMAGPSETLESPWPPFAVRPCPGREPKEQKTEDYGAQAAASLAGGKS